MGLNESKKAKAGIGIFKKNFTLQTFLSCIVDSEALFILSILIRVKSGRGIFHAYCNLMILMLTGTDSL